MLDDTPTTSRPVRRVSPIARALRPVQLRIGLLQEQVAFLVARNLYAMRQPGDGVSSLDVADKRRELAETVVELETTIAGLPQKLRADGRVGDTRAAIARLDRALDILGNGPDQ